MKIGSILTKSINYLVTPIVWNLPLFLISILMLGGFDMLYYQHLYHEYEISEILSGYAEMVFMAYIINIVCYLLRKIHFHIFDDRRDVQDNRRICDCGDFHHPRRALEETNPTNG